MSTTGMTHKQSGIDKRVSEAVYPSDILSDAHLRQCQLITRGAWYECLLTMWRDKSDSITGTNDSLARLWGCTIVDVEHIIQDLNNNNPCKVSLRHDTITLQSRRLARRNKQREQGRKRAITHRSRKSNALSNASVTQEKHPPSISSSISSSISKPKTTTRFVPPAPEEVEAYSNEINYPMDGQAWCDSYEAKGWMIGNNKMKSWKAAARKWKSNRWSPTVSATEPNTSGRRPFQSELKEKIALKKRRMDAIDRTDNWRDNKTLKLERRQLYADIEKIREEIANLP